MSDFEMLSIMLMILGIVVSILITYINHIKSNRPGQKVAVTFRNYIIWTNHLSVVPFHIFILTKRWRKVKLIWWYWNLNWE